MATDIPPYRWFIAVLADGTYRFIPPTMLVDAEQYIGEHGGGVYSHAGYLIFAANKSWWQWLTKKNKQSIAATDGKEYDMEPFAPHIDVPNIECTFSESALKWLEENEEALKEKGGKYYDFIPRH